MNPFPVKRSNLRTARLGGLLLAAVVLAVWCTLAPATAAAQAAPTLYQSPTANDTHIVFVYGGDLWSVPRGGGDARRLTVSVGPQFSPRFSPDGKMVAFTSDYEGNLDVYVVPAAGGVPRRLTWHPGADIVVGWTRDSKQVLFRSTRGSHHGAITRIFAVSLDGNWPTELPLDMAWDISHSPDGAHAAYVPFARADLIWKGYRGGRTTPIWIARLSDSRIEKLPRDNSNDFNPMWIGDKVYFLSDRNGRITLFAYDTKTRQVTQVLKNDGLDLKSAQAAPGAIIYEQFGTVHLYEFDSGRARKVEIRLAGDLSGVRPRFERVASRATNAALSPAGARAVFEARGEIFSVPAEKGDVRNLTRSSGVADRYPSWSPDGKWIAYFSDDSGEYELYLREQSGLGEVKKITPGNSPSYYYSPVWSPDSKKIAYHDKRLNLWYVEVESGKSVKVDTNYYDHPERSLDPVWASDSRWIAYTKRLASQLHAVFIYSLESGKSTQVTDGLSDARYPQFDKNGKYLYFTASTDVALTTGWLDMSSVGRPVTRSVYVTVLRKDLPSPLAPESDEEKVAEPPKEQEKKPGEEKPAEKPKEPPKVEIDFDGILQRILTLPIPARTYVSLQSGKSGILFIIERPAIILPGMEGATVHKFELEKRKVDKFLDGINFFIVSHNGEKALFRMGQERWFIGGTAQTPKPGEGALKMDGMEMRVDPPAEWRQMYRETWRIQRDFLYDPGAHGLDLKAAEKRYEPYLASLAHRADLNYLFQEMLGNLVLGHTYVFGGDIPQARQVPGGLLGADYSIEKGRYRFARVYDGENWNPELRAPLTQPGVNVAAGEYLLAVNGRELRASDNLYSFFEASANRQTVLRVGPNADGTGARDVTVVPVNNEIPLRHFAWIEGNRRKVEEMTGGRVAYVYLPNTGGAGYTYFNRYFFAQVGKEAAVIDERFNGGGLVADYIIDYLRRPLLNYFHTREGADFTVPFAAIFGPKSMIINEFAGSGGDALPWMFRKSGLGPLIGKRTWGGLVGIYDYPPLMDGGAVTAPRLAFWNPDGTWDVENWGVPADIEVEHDPELVRQGRDPQLERAVAEVLDALKKNPLPKHTRPAYPNYYRRR